MKILSYVQEGIDHNTIAKELIKLAKEGKALCFWIEDGLLYTNGRRLYVPG